MQSRVVIVSQWEGRGGGEREGGGYRRGMPAPECDGCEGREEEGGGDESVVELNDEKKAGSGQGALSGDRRMTKQPAPRRSGRAPGDWSLAPVRALRGRAPLSAGAWQAGGQATRRVPG